jgi:peroxiredoxin
MFLCLTSDPATARMLSVGEYAKPFCLQDAEGNPVSLQQRLDGGAVLMMFSSLGCWPCEESEPVLEEAGTRYAGHLEVIYVMLSELDLVQRKVAAENANHGARFLVDSAGDDPFATARAYGVMATPTTFLIDQNGKVVWRHIGRITMSHVESEIPEALWSNDPTHRSDLGAVGYLAQGASFSRPGDLGTAQK